MARRPTPAVVQIHWDMLHSSPMIGPFTYVTEARDFAKRVRKQLKANGHKCEVQVHHIVPANFALGWEECRPSVIEGGLLTGVENSG